MQIRCYSCHMPFALNKDVVLAALDFIESENMQHYNAACPRCRKVNRVSREQLLRAAPDWVPPQDRPEEIDEPGEISN